MLEEEQTTITSEPPVGRVRAESIADGTGPVNTLENRLPLIVEGDEKQTTDSPSSQEGADNDGHDETEQDNDQPPALTPDPKQKTLITEGTTPYINEDDKRPEEESQIDDENCEGNGNESSEENPQSNDEDGDGDGDGNESSEEEPQSDGEGDDNEGITDNPNDKSEVETGDSSLEGSSINNGAPHFLTGLVTSLTAYTPTIKFYELPNKAIEYSNQATDSLKRLLPENFKISPEMSFAGGVITGKTINPTLRYANDLLTGDNNKDLSLFDYYSFKGFSASNTMKSFAYMVGKSHLTFYGIDLIKSHLLSDNAAEALTAVMSYCKATVPMTFTVGLAITTAPQAIELGVNVITSGYNQLTSLAGLSSSVDDAEL